MLKSLYINNIVLIEENEIEFQEGLNILTGETGAGKSIIIHSINFLLGDRADKSLMRSGSKTSKVKGEFIISLDSRVKSILDYYGIECDGELIVEREMGEKGNVCRINGSKTTLLMLKNVVSNLIDLCGQNENISLLDETTHIDIVDNYSKDKIKPIKEDLLILYKQYQEIKSKMNKLKSLDDIKNKLDEYKNQIKEIENSHIYDGEEELLERENDINENSEHIISSLNSCLLNLQSEYEDAPSAMGILQTAMVEISKISDYSKELGDVYERLSSVEIELSDIISEIDTLQDKYSFDEERAQYVQDRLEVIYKLEKKYGNSIKDVLNYLKDIKNTYDDFSDADLTFKKLEIEKKETLDKLYKQAINLSNFRRDVSLKLEKKIEKELNDLGMSGTKFSVVFSNSPKREDVEKHITPNGFDNVEFMLKTNVGQDMKKLNKIISGGEMSRFMLAAKSVLTDDDEDKTLIFDEIDTGIGGKVAHSVAEKLRDLSTKKQILSVTHLAQIAVMADIHFLISKFVKDNNTFSDIKILKGDEKIKEIARLTSGDDTSEIAIKHAKEMLNKVR